MRILLVSSYFLPSEGGVERYTYYIARELAERGYDVTILTLSRSSLRDKAPVNLKITTLPDNVKVKRYQYFTFRFIFPRKSDFLSFNHKLVEDIFKGNYDIAHIQGIYTLHDILAMFSSYLKGVPRVFTTHGILEAYSTFWKCRLIGSIINLSDKVVCQTKQEIIKARQIGVGSQKIVYIPNGIDQKRFLNKPSSDVINHIRGRFNLRKNVILSVSPISAMKGLEYSIEALKLIPSKKDISYVIAGNIKDKKYFTELVELCKKYNITDNVKFLGWLDDDSLVKLYFSSDVFVAPHIKTTASLVVLEAMAAGLPVIATRVGGFPDMIVHGVTGFLVKPKDPNEIANYICLLLSDKTLREKIGNTARRFVLEKRSWSKISSMLIELYRELIK